MLIFLDGTDGTAQDVIDALESYDRDSAKTIAQSDRIKKMIKSIKEKL